MLCGGGSFCLFSQNRKPLLANSCVSLWYGTVIRFYSESLNGKCDFNRIHFWAEKNIYVIVNISFDTHSISLKLMLFCCCRLGFFNGCVM